MSETDLEQWLVEHQLEVSPLTGSAELTVPIPASMGRDGFGPRLALRYSSGAANSPFGVGWLLTGVPTIARDVHDHIPSYVDRDDAIVFGVDELVPYQIRTTTGWARVTDELGDYHIERYRAAREQSFDRFERHLHRPSGRVHWMRFARSGAVSIFGRSAPNLSRIADPADPDTRAFQWLLEAEVDPLGNAIVYEYKAEDAVGVDASLSYEARRTRTGPFAQRYLKRVRYGNSVPLSVTNLDRTDVVWHFELTFDYGEHGKNGTVPSYAETTAWDVRTDAFSSCRPGFEVRTWRRCQRLFVTHRFDQLGPVPRVVSSIELGHTSDPAGATLTTVTARGYRTDLDTNVVESIAKPPLVIDYSSATPQPAFTLAAEANNAPIGFDGDRYQWADLLGEGLPGILAERGDAWYFKRNLGDGQFGPLEPVTDAPASLSASFRLRDFDRDGNVDLVGVEGREAGFYTCDRETGRWAGYQPFVAQPRVDLANARAQWVDLDGDGAPELVIDDDDHLTWYPAMGVDGFGSSIALAKLDATSGGAPSIAERAAVRTFFADMNGDGLVDVVSIGAGCVTYWPNLGHGRFGSAVEMADAPSVSGFGDSDPARYRFVDLDGSGTTDLLYLGDGEILCWTNQCGNGFGPPRRLASLPRIDNLSSVDVLDLNGDGTSCLVWSTPLPGHQARAIHVLPLTGGTPPRLLQRVSNSAGRVTVLAYRWSARDYLRDAATDTPWHTLLPQQQIVVARRELQDAIGGGRLVTRYEYHDGVYDGVTRQFIGFARVDTFDADLLAPGDTEAVPPTVVRRFFLTGEPPESTRGRDGDGELPAPEIADIGTLTTEEQLAAYRALAGLPRREEIYATGADGKRTGAPLRIEESAYRVRRLAPTLGKSSACFTAESVESLKVAREGDATDPRVEHQVVLGFDAYGSPARTALVAYPRRAGAGRTVDAVQGAVHLTVTDSTILTVDTPSRFEADITVEERQLAVHGVRPLSALFDCDALATDVATAMGATLLGHTEPVPAAGGARARLLTWRRHYYWNTARTAPLPLGQVGPVTLHHHAADAYLSADAAAAAYDGRVTPAMLSGEGGYAQADGAWWATDGLATYAGPDDFYRLVRQDHAGGDFQAFTFDGARLNVRFMDDATGGQTEHVIDYQALAPGSVIDPNRNITETRYDALALEAVVAVHGQQLGADGQPHPVGAADLTAYAWRGAVRSAQVLADPERYLQLASSFRLHDLSAFLRGDGPVCTVELQREIHAQDGEGGATAPSRIQVEVTYVDGFGRTIQAKRLVDPGPAIARDAAGGIITDGVQPILAQAAERWLATGYTLYNNKGWVVRRYEPFYSPTAAFEDDAAIQVHGVATRLRYDVAGRIVREESPDGTATINQVTAWRTTTFDQNDNVVGSAWEAARQGLPTTDPERRALEGARAHANTPTIQDLDPRGRVYRTRETGVGGADRVTVSDFDDFGIPTVTDARGVRAVGGLVDLMGRPLVEVTADAGRRWTLLDAAGRIAHRWDAIGNHRVHQYGPAGRLRAVLVDGGAGGAPVRMVQRFVYGDETGAADAWLRNIVGRVVEVDDDAGRVVVDKYHLGGQPVDLRRDLTAHYAVLPDWTTPAGVALAATGYRVRTVLDAQDRVVRQDLPDGTVREYTYSAQGHVATVRVSTTDGRFDHTVIADGIEAGARGNRARVHLGNDVDMRWEYDPASFRLTGHRATGANGTGRRYTDVRYTYDPVGNVTRWIDTVQEPAAPAPVLQGAAVTSASDYTYDAFYRLRTATGRVHQLLEMHDDTARPGQPGIVKGTRHLTLNNGAALERYRRTYDYDAAGNLTRVAHVATSRSFTRDIWTSATSNRSLPATDLAGNGIVDPETWFDANGNTIRMPHLRRLTWDYADRLTRAVVIERPAGSTSDAEYYAYDGDGLRVRRTSERLVTAGLVEVVDTVYLSDCEIRRVTRNGQLILERLTSHVGDGAIRFAAIHRWTRDQLATETDDPTVPRVHYLIDNQLGSTRLELDATADVISYEEYFPYGGTSFIAGDQLRDVGLKEYRFQGKLRDDVTGFYAFMYRYYVPWIGHWLSPDPAGPIDGANLYAFVQGNPIRFTDAAGLATGGGLHVERADALPSGIQQMLSADPGLRERWLKDQVYFQPDGNGGWRVLTADEFHKLVQRQSIEGTTTNLAVLSEQPVRDPDTERQLAAANTAERIIDSLDLPQLLKPVVEAKLPKGDVPDSTHGDAAKGTSHAADGNSTIGANQPGTSGESGTNGSGTTGTGAGGGTRGKGPDSAPTPADTPAKGPARGAGANATPPSIAPPGVGGVDVGDAQGADGGVKEGVVGGTAPTRPPPGATVDPSATPEATGATPTGTAPTTTTSATGPDGRGTPGSDAAGGTRPDGVAGGRRGGQGSATSGTGGAGREGHGTGGPESLLDKAVGVAGKVNLVFDQGEGRERGGLPGSLGLLGWKGPLIQSLYLVYTAVSTFLMVQSIVKSVSTGALRQGLSRLLNAIRSPGATLKGLWTAGGALIKDTISVLSRRWDWVKKGQWARLLRNGGKYGPGDFARMLFKDVREWPSIQHWRDHVSVLFRQRLFGKGPFYNIEHIIPQSVYEKAGWEWTKPFINSYANTFLRLPAEFNSSLGNRLIPKLTFYVGALEANIRALRFGERVGDEIVDSALATP